MLHNLEGPTMVLHRDTGALPLILTLALTYTLELFFIIIIILTLALT